MNYAPYLLIIAMVLTACDFSPQHKDVAPASIKIGGVYSFAATRDVHACSADSILGSDCGGGTLYFTPHGNVVYSFFCLGADTTTYDLGKYTVSSGKVVCVFDGSYSFYDPQMSLEPVERNINSGQIIKITGWRIEINAVKCDQYPYYFKAKDGDNYVVYKDGNGSKQALADISHIKAFSDL